MEERAGPHSPEGSSGREDVFLPFSWAEILEVEKSKGA